MPLYRGDSYLVLEQDDLSDWIKGKSLTVKSLSAVVKFLWKNLIYRFNIFKKLIINEGLKFNSIIKNLLKKYKMY